MLEEFGILPVENATLDITDLVANLENHPAALRLPGKIYSSNRKDLAAEFIYFIFIDVKLAAEASEWVQGGNNIGHFYGCFAKLEVTPRYIHVFQQAFDVVLQQVAELVLPVIKNQPCRIFTELGDATSRYQDHPERLFA